jgi:hypothetical protein
LDRERAPILGSELPEDAGEFGLETLDLVDEHRGDHLGERGSRRSPSSGSCARHSASWAVVIDMDAVLRARSDDLTLEGDDGGGG